MTKTYGLPTELNISLSTFEGDIEEAKTVFIGIPYFIKTRSNNIFFKNTDILRIMRDKVEDNSLLCRNIYYSTLRLLDLGDIQSLTYDDIKDDITTIFSLSKLKNKNIIFLGGEHTFTYFIVENIHPRNIIVFDAHLDLKDTLNFDKFNLATYLRRLTEKIKDINIYLAGIRSYDEDEYEYLQSRKEVKTIDIEQLKNLKLEGITHLSIDLDVLDINIFSSTTYPEPNGLNFTELLSALKTLFRTNNIRTADIMEFNPRADRLEEAIIVLRLIYEIATLMEHKKCI